jgi:hypothetical protein
MVDEKRSAREGEGQHHEVWCMRWASSPVPVAGSPSDLAPRPTEVGHTTRESRNARPWDLELG